MTFLSLLLDSICFLFYFLSTDGVTGHLLGYTCEGLARADLPGAQSPWLLGGE